MVHSPGKTCVVDCVPHELHQLMLGASSVPQPYQHSLWKQSISLLKDNRLHSPAFAASLKVRKKRDCCLFLLGATYFSLAYFFLSLLINTSWFRYEVSPWDFAAASACGSPSPSTMLAFTGLQLGFGVQRLWCVEAVSGRGFLLFCEHCACLCSRISAVLGLPSPR